MVDTVIVVVVEVDLALRMTVEDGIDEVADCLDVWELRIFEPNVKNERQIKVIRISLINNFFITSSLFEVGKLISYIKP